MIERNAKASRYMSVRYAAAVLFFANLWWSLALIPALTPVIVIPLANLVIFSVVTGEAVWIVTTDREFMRLSFGIVGASAMISVALLLVAIVLGPELVLAIPADRVVALIALAVAVILKAGVLRQIMLIKRHRDRRYAYCAYLLERADDSKVR
ncbi:hypothetical protein [Coriobacterium glomerans]|nr:hypothetical protein [Coriobacterium glomerans]